MKIFLCKNCEYKQHQCFICGVLEPSDGEAAKVCWHCIKEKNLCIRVFTSRDLSTHKIFTSFRPARIRGNSLYPRDGMWRDVSCFLESCVQRLRDYATKLGLISGSLGMIYLFRRESHCSCQAFFLSFPLPHAASHYSHFLAQLTPMPVTDYHLFSPRPPKIFNLNPDTQ